MYRVSIVSYNYIKDQPIFDKEAERVYKMYSNPNIKIYILEEKNKMSAICIAHDGDEIISVLHFHSSNMNNFIPFATYFKSQEKKKISVYLPKEYQKKCEKGLTKLGFNYIDNIHAYVFAPSQSQNLSFWKEFYSKRGHKVIKYLVDHGCDRCSFEEAKDDPRFAHLELLPKLKEMLDNHEFDDSYNPFTKNDFDPHFSYIAFYQNKPIAYLTIKHINDILLLDHLSLSVGEAHNGVSLLLISKFINHVIQDYEEDPDKYFEVRTKAIREKSSMYHLLEGSLNKIIFQQKEKALFEWIRKENSN